MYGVNLDGAYRGIVAATSMTAAAKILGLPAHTARQYGGETGNAKEIEIAMREPGIAYKQHMSWHCSEYIRMGE